MNESIRKAYNTGAVAYREKYDSIPPRTEDIDIVFSHSNASNPKVFEIGCAYGREARCILEKTPHYIGVDISQEYINMAQAEVSGGTFICSDVLEYEFPSQIDIIFAFASLLHLDKTELTHVLKKAYESLSPGGVLFLSLKHATEYHWTNVNDGVSERRFYYYNKETILELCNELYSEVFYDEQVLKEPWFTMILKKKNT